MCRDYFEGSGKSELIYKFRSILMEEQGNWVKCIKMLYQNNELSRYNHVRLSLRLCERVQNKFFETRDISPFPRKLNKKYIFSDIIVGFGACAHLNATFMPKTLQALPNGRLLWCLEIALRIRPACLIFEMWLSFMWKHWIFVPVSIFPPKLITMHISLFVIAWTCKIW